MPTQEPEEVTVDEYTPNRATRRAKASKTTRATFRQLISKKPREKEIVLKTGEEELSFLFRSLSAKEWDLLVSKYPPTKDQRLEGQPFNVDTFPPALLSRVCIDPVLSVEEWEEIWESDSWNRGEIGDLYGQAVNLCTQGFSIPFNESA